MVLNHRGLNRGCVSVLRKPGPVVSRSTYTQKRTAGGGVTRLGEVGGGLEDDEGVGGDDRRRDGGEVVRVVGGRGGARGAVCVLWKIQFDKRSTFAITC